MNSVISKICRCKPTRETLMNNEPAEKSHAPQVQYDAPLDDALRPHVYAGDIQEYDKRLPNWWLWTLYGAIAFAFGYWSLFHHWHIADEPGTALDAEMKANALAAAADSGVLDDAQMWLMSRDPAVVAAGQSTFSSTCASCHNTDASGKIGPNLRDEVWIHGGSPHEIVSTITTGVAVKGMPTWGPVLGKKKINEVAAFILSLHKEGEPVIPAAQAAASPKTAQN